MAASNKRITMTISSIRLMADVEVKTDHGMGTHENLNA